MNISAAIDFSTVNATLAICDTDSDNIIFTANRPMSGRESSSLLPWIISQLKENGYTLKEITKWTCGTGPGSFTGLRIAASLVAGLTYAKENIEVRGIPSGTAIANALSAPGEKRAVLYDGKRGDIICYTPPPQCIAEDKDQPLSTNSTSLPTPSTQIIFPDNMQQLDSFDKLCAMESEKTALEKIVPQKLMQKIRFLTGFPIEKLLINKTYKWQNNSSGESLFEPDLVYIRPAV